MNRHRSCFPSLLLVLMIIVLSVVAAAISVPALAWKSFGAPSRTLNSWQRFNYALDLLVNARNLNQARSPTGAEQTFVIQPGESVSRISQRLEAAGLIRSAQPFRSYLIWTGMDTIIQTGTYRLSPAQTAQAIAQALKSTTLTDVPFSVLPGWRMEEVAESLPTSGLVITPAEFLAAASFPAVAPDFFPAGASAEGFLAVGKNILPRSTNAEQLVSLLIQNFTTELTPELRTGFAAHGLSVYQAVTLASIIQREAVVENEMPVIASVFYNRLAIDMPLQTDPTIQYALGFNVSQATWWTNPLSAQDLQVNSPYNTYTHAGLPPGPISNPGLAALQAVATPAESSYYYFQARCDKSGLHNFSETLEQHQQNNCQ